MLSINSHKVTFSLIFIIFLGSCGTARGVLHGAGTVLEGMATDARTVGNWIR
jgi:hypothetical protein